MNDVCAARIGVNAAHQLGRERCAGRTVHAMPPCRSRRGRTLRAGASYLGAIGVTEDTLPNVEPPAKLRRLTIEVMRHAG